MKKKNIRIYTIFKLSFFLSHTQKSRTQCKSHDNNLSLFRWIYSKYDAFVEYTVTNTNIQLYILYTEENTQQRRTKNTPNTSREAETKFNKKQVESKLSNLLSLVIVVCHFCLLRRFNYFLLISLFDCCIM